MRLTRQVAHLEAKLTQAEAIIDIQKKVSALLGLPPIEQWPLTRWVTLQQRYGREPCVVPYSSRAVRSIDAASLHDHLRLVHRHRVP